MRLFCKRRFAGEICKRNEKQRKNATIISQLIKTFPKVTLFHSLLKFFPPAENKV